MEAESLVGKSFHTFTDGSEVRYQGRVLKQENDRIWVQLYSFVTGDEDSAPQWLSLQEHNFKFYDSDAEMRAAYQRYENDEARKQRKTR